MLRYALLEAARRLVRQRRLPGPRHVFFLRWEELRAALLGSSVTELGRLAIDRVAERQAQRRRRPPARFGNPLPSTPVPELSPEALQALHALWSYRPAGSRPTAIGRPLTHDGHQRGAGASPGAYTGAARVISVEAQYHLVQPGDVLVCGNTRPSWKILSGRIGALVTDDGGVLSHSAVAAREFGIPAVIGTRTATAAIANGQVVRVDGAAGTVRLIQAPGLGT